jgi:hypothetical protein
MKQFDNRGRKIDYDAPGQIGRFSPKTEKLKVKAPLYLQLDRLCEYWAARGQPDRPLHVTLAQLRILQRVPKEQVEYVPTGQERYSGHLLFVVDEEP